MPSLIKNWKLNLLAVFFMGLFSFLGYWQLTRAWYKEQLINQYQQRLHQPPISQQNLNPQADLRFFQVTLTGYYDNQHTLLLDNKTFHGTTGYEVYTPFRADNLSSIILVDRGFINNNGNRSKTPQISPITGKQTINGLLNLPPKQIVMNENIFDPLPSAKLLRVETLNFAKLEKALGYVFFPYTLTLAAADSNAYTIEWQAVTLPPERHYAYATQWFAFAITLLIIFAILNWRAS